MFIAIIGTGSSGKSTVEKYLVAHKGFTSVRLENSGGAEGASGLPNSDLVSHSNDLHLDPTLAKVGRSPCFASAKELLRHVTEKWRDNFVTVDLCTRQSLELFVRRPFFMLLNVDAPLYERFLRSNNSRPTSLEEFVQNDDRVVFGVKPNLPEALRQTSSLQSLNNLVNIQIANSFQTISDLHTYLDDLNLLNPEHLRPGWDTYFMTLASLASKRSNCMKRRVGAVLVRENRVLATGYNGTSRGVPNCNEGGCPVCNGTSANGDLCVCLHAEENALLEAGRERVGINAVLYCNTCPCLKCTAKIIQVGVKTVVYNLTFKMDDASASLFQKAGVELRRYNLKKIAQLPAGDVPKHAFA